MRAKSRRSSGFSEGLGLSLLLRGQMPKQVYITVGNHKSLVGINEIIYTLYSALCKSFGQA